MATRNRSFAKLAPLLDASGDLTNDAISPDVSIGVDTYDSIGLLPYSNNTAGDQAFITSTGRMYIHSGEGWYNIALINRNPSIVSILDENGDSDFSVLSNDGSTTTITITATDSDGDLLTYSAVGDSDFNNMASISQDSSVFTISPFSIDSATTTAGDITFSVTDGINQITSDKSFTLSFFVDFSFFGTRSGADITPGGGLSAQIITASYSGDGLKVYINGDGSYNTLRQYNMSTAGDFSDLSSATYSSPDETLSLGHVATGVGWKKNGTKLYTINGSTIREFDLSTAWDISTATFNQSASVSVSGVTSSNMYFNGDGTKLMLLRNGSSVATVGAVPLSTAWDISTVGTPVTETFNYLNDLVDAPNAKALCVKYDGTEMIIADEDNVNRFTMSTPFDPSTATRTGSVSQFSFATASNVRDVATLYSNFYYPNVLIGGFSQSSNYKITDITYTV